MTSCDYRGLIKASAAERLAACSQNSEGNSRNVVRFGELEDRDAIGGKTSSADLAVASLGDTSPESESFTVHAL